MPKPIPTFDWSILDAARREVVSEAHDPYPDRSFTIHDYMERYEVNRQAAQHQLEQLTHEGILQKGKRRIVSTNGSHRLVLCYWMPPSPEEEQG